MFLSVFFFLFVCFSPLCFLCVLCVIPFIYKYMFFVQILSSFFYNKFFSVFLCFSVFILEPLLFFEDTVPFFFFLLPF